MDGVVIVAPEVIEMAGWSFASDIWSVGCTIIELLTTKPPYFDLAPMAALFRIVQDDHPPLPERISPVRTASGWSGGRIGRCTGRRD